MTDFESLGLKAGVWAGVLRRPAAPRRVLLTHLAVPVAEAKIRPDQPGTWRIEVALPAQCLEIGRAHV